MKIVWLSGQGHFLQHPENVFSSHRAIFIKYYRNQAEPKEDVHFLATYFLTPKGGKVIFKTTSTTLKGGDYQRPRLS